MTRIEEQSLKAKLMKLAKEEGVPFNHMLDKIFLERYLVRISASPFASILIFKGGMCLAQIIDLRRETKDIDFLLRSRDSSLENIKSMFDKISSTAIDDGFEFRDVDISNLSIKHKQYPGWGISIHGKVGKIQKKIFIDVGMGDEVEPQSLAVVLLGAKGHFYEEKVQLEAYPPEYIFSEKFEAILHLGSINGRMKDYYDCWRLIKEDVLDDDRLKAAIVRTCKNRKTEITSIPDYSIEHGPRWKSFIKNMKDFNVSIVEVIDLINSKIGELNLQIPISDKPKAT